MGDKLNTHRSQIYRGQKLGPLREPARLTIGRKLRGLGRSHQVLCITHLPQVAAQGQSHFAVEKRVKQNRTLTELTRLEGAARQRELARMLGGQTDAALALAKSLLADTGAA